MRDWVDALEMEEARDAIEEAYEEASGDLADRLFAILTALDEGMEILMEDLGTISEAICMADEAQEYGLGDRLFDAIIAIKKKMGISLED